ncbi:hypothetical protein BC834DRAFT_894298 [Gloeopeniophorella convolvens]|nr:hypothetical protein BC834DRAFT_894298 [Gloeopeniophorella convolvens]
MRADWRSATSCSRSGSMRVAPGWGWEMSHVPTGSVRRCSHPGAAGVRLATSLPAQHTCWTQWTSTSVSHYRIRVTAPCGLCAGVGLAAAEGGRGARFPPVPGSNCSPSLQLFFLWVLVSGVVSTALVALMYASCMNGRYPDGSDIRWRLLYDEFRPTICYSRSLC